MKKFFTSILIFAFIFTTAANGQVIITVAGGGEGYTGDSSAATAAELHWPKDIKFDRYGNMYVADANNNVVRKIDTFGIITTIAGNGAQAGSGMGSYGGDGGAATAASLYDPSGVFVDNSGNVYIADHLNNCIRKVGANDTINTLAGTGVQGYTGDGGPASSATLNQPTRLTFDTKGNIYIADAGNNCIRKIQTDNTIVTVVGTGVAGYSGDGGAAATATLSHPNDIAVDVIGNLYIADMYNHVIRKVDTFGNISTIGGTGIPGYRDSVAATAGQFYDPAGIALDDSGNIFISDRGNARVRKIDSAGMLRTVAGNGTSGYNGDNISAKKAWLQYPEGLANKKGFLFFADQGNNRIRTFNAKRFGVGVNNVNQPDGRVDVFPNPNNGLFFIRLTSPDGAPGHVTLADVTGRVITSKDIIVNNPVDLTAPAPGIYILTVSTEYQKWVEKIVVRQ